MKLKIRNLLTVSFITLGLLTLSACASTSNIKLEVSIKHTQSLTNSIEKIDEVNRTPNKKVVSYKDQSIVGTLRKNQLIQPDSIKQPVQDLSLLVKIFAAFVFVGFISGCVGSVSGFLFHYRQYKKLTEQKSQTLPELKDFGSSEKINVPLREKQIETLERIWKIDL